MPRHALLLALALTGAPTLAVAAPLELVIEGRAFTPAELRVKAGEPIELRVVNRDATAEEFESSALKVEKVVAGHSEAMVRIRPLKPGHYKFVGEYHEDTAHGVIIAE
ncbi:MAG: cupredoxin domain-containing protein [Alphaproteobacteria bacterium]|nr:cupredoxin domain-containing protein [Alphaproteobacteria bacterium]